MAAVFHILILLGAAIAALAILAWAVFEIADLLRWIFPSQKNDR